MFFWVFLAIALDKFFAIHCPFGYNSKMTTTSAVCVGILINMYAVIIAAIPLAGYNRFSTNKKCVFTLVNEYGYLIFLAVHVLTIVMTIVCLYALIGRTAVRQMRKIADVTFVSQQNTCTNQEAQPSVNNLKINIKAINNLTIVVGAFAICCVPFAIYLLFVSRRSDPVTEPSPVVEFLRVIFLAMMVVNSAINPVIYALKFPQYSKSFRKLLLREDQTSVIQY